MIDQQTTSVGRAPVASGPPRGRRDLTLADRLVRAPLGLLWLIVLIVLAVPVIVYMTVLYYTVRAAPSLTRGRSPTPNVQPRGEK